MSHDPASEGNRYFNAGQHNCAEEAYTNAIALNPTNAKLYYYRAVNYFKLESFEKALNDAKAGLERDASYLNLHITLANALYKLERLDDAISALNEAFQRIDGAKTNFHLTRLMDKVQNRKRTEVTYELIPLIEHAKKSRFLGLKYADYIMWDKFEVKMIEGKRQRRLVATKRIAPGMLLIANRAYFYGRPTDLSINPGMPLAKSSKEADVLLKSWPRSEKEKAIIGKLIDQFYDYPADAIEFLKLSTKGFEYDKLKSNIPQLIEALDECARVGTSSSVDQLKLLTDGCDDTGIWINTSYLSSACVEPNCFQFTIGDFVLVRSIKQIEPGQLLTVEYVSPECSYKIREAYVLGRFGYVCECRLCDLDRKEPTVCAHFESINTEYQGITKRMANNKRADKKDVQNLKQLYFRFVNIRTLDMNFQIHSVLQTIINITMNEASSGMWQPAANFFEKKWKIYAKLGLVREAMRALKQRYKDCDSKDFKEADVLIEEGKKLVQVAYGSEKIYWLVYYAA